MIYLICGSDPTRQEHDHSDLTRLGQDPLSFSELISVLAESMMDPNLHIYVVRACDNTPGDQLLPNALQRQRRLLGSEHKLKPDGSVDRSWKPVNSLIDEIVGDLGDDGRDDPGEEPPPRTPDTSPESPAPPGDLAPGPPNDELGDGDNSAA